MFFNLYKSFLIKKFCYLYKKYKLNLLKLFKLLSITSLVFSPLSSMEAGEYKFENIKYDQFKEQQSKYEPKDKLDEYIINGATYSTKFVPLMNGGAEGSISSIKWW